MKRRKNNQIWLLIAITSIGCSQQVGEFPRNETIEVFSETTYWNFQRLSGEWVPQSDEFPLSNILLTENSLTPCLVPTEDISSRVTDRILYEANQENCHDITIREWDDNRFLGKYANPSGDIGFFSICETSATEIVCYSIINEAPAAVLASPERYKPGEAEEPFVTEVTTYTIRQ